MYTSSHHTFTAFIRGGRTINEASSLLLPTDNDMKRGFGRSKQWKELFNVIKPQYYMNAKVMSRIVARKTQQEAYTRQMMLIQPMRIVNIYTSDKVRLIIMKYIVMNGRH